MVLTILSRLLVTVPKRSPSQINGQVHIQHPFVLSSVNVLLASLPFLLWLNPEIILHAYHLHNPYKYLIPELKIIHHIMLFNYGSSVAFIYISDKRWFIQKIWIVNGLMVILANSLSIKIIRRAAKSIISLVMLKSLSKKTSSLLRLHKF